MNLANKITLFRIVIIPFFVAALYLQTDYAIYLSAGLFFVAAASDGVDGYVARHYNQITNLGKLLDPLADKLLIASALVCLVDLHLIPAWMAIVILTREFAVTGMRQIAAIGNVVVAASFSGKLKTFVQIVAILFLILHLPYGYWLMLLAVILTVYSGIDYLIRMKDYVFKS